jgi:AraC-like DNA-binding protein
MSQNASLHTHQLIGFEDLSELVLGAQSEIVQIGRGKIRGHFTHASIGGLPINAGTFSVGVRTRGAHNRDRVTIGMLTGSTDRVVRSPSYELCPGDVLVTPPGGEHEGQYFGGASLFVISLSPEEIESMFGTESELTEPGAWRRNLYKGSSNTAQRVIPCLQMLVATLGKRDLVLTEAAAEFWKRAVVEAMTANVLRGMPSGYDGPLPSALRLVRRTEEYLDARELGPVHISEICSRLGVSRRTLHRAFHEAIGVGPVSFLRHRRLCTIHTALRLHHADDMKISDLAMQYGFLNMGRFAEYYRKLFGEYPSETRRLQVSGDSAAPVGYSTYTEPVAIAD